MDDGAQTGGSLRAGAEFTTSSPRGFTIVGLQGIRIEYDVSFSNFLCFYWVPIINCIFSLY